MKALGVSHQFLSKPCDAEILQGTISRAFALRDLAGNESVKALVARINKLPTLPATYQKLVEMLKSRTPHRRRLERDLHRSGDDCATAQARELRVLRPRQAGRRRGARGRPARPRSHHGAGARPGNLLRAAIPEGGGFSIDALWITAWPRRPPRIASPSKNTWIATRSPPRFSPACCTTSASWCWRWACRSIREGAQAGAAPGQANCSISRCSSCRPRTPMSAPTWWACGACLTPSPRPSPTTRIRRSRRTSSFGLPGIVHVADRIAHHPDVADARSPELRLNLAYLESRNNASTIGTNGAKSAAPHVARKVFMNDASPVCRRRAQRAGWHPPPVAQSRRRRDRERRRGRSRDHRFAVAPSPWWSPTCACRKWTARASSRACNEIAPDTVRMVLTGQADSTRRSRPSTKAAYSASC